MLARSGKGYPDRLGNATPHITDYLLPVGGTKTHSLIHCHSACATSEVKIKKRRSYRHYDVVPGIDIFCCNYMWHLAKVSLPFHNCEGAVDDAALYPKSLVKQFWCGY